MAHWLDKYTDEDVDLADLASKAVLNRSLMDFVKLVENLGGEVTEKDFKDFVECGRVLKPILRPSSS